MTLTEIATNDNRLSAFVHRRIPAGDITKRRGDGMGIHGKQRRLSQVAVTIAVAVAATIALGTVTSNAQAATSGTLIGAYSRDWSWFDANVGRMQVYRGYDTGFQFATWGQTVAATAHPQDPANPTFVNDYSFNLPPNKVADGSDDAQLTKFIATTPKNIVLTNYHEPEQEIDAGQFTFQQFLNSTTHLAYLVHQQNLADQGTRRVSVILMVESFSGFKGRHAINYWPTTLPSVTNPVTHLPVGEDFADVISADAYALPHATSTAGVPAGYTDGLRWKSAATLLSPVLTFANANHTHWAVSELGYLEDTHNPTHRSTEITAAASYSSTGKLTPTSVPNPALYINYWDSRGRRADWQLRWNNPPVPSTSGTSNAAVTWRHLAGNP